jgi:hypothetical protein
MFPTSYIKTVTNEECEQGRIGRSIVKNVIENIGRLIGDLEDPLQRSFAGVHEKVVEKGADGSAKHWGYNRDPRIVVEVMGASPKYFRAVDEVGEKTRCQITSGVDSVSGLPAESHTNTNNEKADHERAKGAGTSVGQVVDGKDAKDKNSGDEELFKESTLDGHEGSGIGREDSGGGVSANDDAVPTIEIVEGLEVIGVEDSAGQIGAAALSNPVAYDLIFGKLAEDGKSKGDGGVEVGTRDTTTGINAHHHSDTPANVNGNLISMQLPGEHGLGDDTVSKQYENEGAPELCNVFAKAVPVTADGGQPYFHFGNAITISGLFHGKLNVVTHYDIIIFCFLFFFFQ